MRGPREGGTSAAVPGPGRLPEGDRQRSGRGAAGHASRASARSTWPPASTPASTSSARSRSPPMRPACAPCSQPRRRRKQKNLSLVAGFCWRYNNMIQDTFQQMEDGAIGKLVAYYATYYTSPVKPMPPASTRPAGMSDVEWQIRNWYNFVWLCGDSLVEQAVHSVGQDRLGDARRAAGELRRRRRPHHSGRGRQHLRSLRGQLHLSERRARVPGQPPDSRAATTRTPTTSWAPRAPARSAAARTRASRARPTGPSRASSTTCTRRSTTCCSPRSARASR